jgi:hypothetical protein
MSRFIKHTSCDHCGSSDANAIYDDGSEYCFSCHYTKKSQVSGYVVPKYDTDDQPLSVPDGLTKEFPEVAVNWLAKYELSLEEIIKHDIYWYPYREQLVYVYKDSAGLVRCIQARNFSKEAKQKYYNQGSPKAVLPIIRAKEGTNRLVIVEDTLSAIKIARQCDAMPLLGSYLPVDKLMRLQRLYSKITVWLDHDKFKEAYEIMDKFKWLGISSNLVLTQKDPKEYTNEQIYQYLM